jgi:uncharacterized protein YjbI with pentapeptide repeats
MAIENPGPSGKEVQAALYRALANSDPAERAETVLRLVEEHPQGRLELPACDGLRATLDGIDLSRGRLMSGHDPAKTSCWWNEERQAVDLRRSDLRGARLRGVHLHGALLLEADLTQADLAGADLQ